MDFMKKHKFKLMLLGVFILVLIISLFALVALLYPDSRKNVYGNRLNGIENVKISNQVITEIKDKVGNKDFVNDIDYTLKGRLINFSIEVKDTTKLNDAKKLVDYITDIFDDDTKSYYDIQVFVVSEVKESKSYPIVAYKHKKSDKFVWTNN